jgi:hypothetical protein
MRHRQDARATAHRIGSRTIPAGALFAAILVTAMLVVAACGSSEPTSTTAAVGSPSTTPTSAAATLGADELGSQIGTIYVAALRDAALALKDKPDVATVRSQIEKLKNDTISKLVELGRAREAMSTADRAKVDAKITAALGAAGGEDWYATYNDVWTHYSGIDNDFANLVAAFNVIGQYANFDLLKQQAPEEAARLGIK